MNFLFGFFSDVHPYLLEALNYSHENRKFSNFSLRKKGKDKRHGRICLQILPGNVDTKIKSKATVFRPNK